MKKIFLTLVFILFIVTPAFATVLELSPMYVRIENSSTADYSRATWTDSGTFTSANVKGYIQADDYWHIYIYDLSDNLLTTLGPYTNSTGDFFSKTISFSGQVSKFKLKLGTGTGEGSRIVYLDTAYTNIGQSAVYETPDLTGIGETNEPPPTENNTYPSWLEHQPTWWSQPVPAWLSNSPNWWQDPKQIFPQWLYEDNLSTTPYQTFTYDTTVQERTPSEVASLAPKTLTTWNDTNWNFTNPVISSTFETEIFTDLSGNKINKQIPFVSEPALISEEPRQAQEPLQAEQPLQKQEFTPEPIITTEEFIPEEPLLKDSVLTPDGALTPDLPLIPDVPLTPQ